MGEWTKERHAKVLEMVKTQQARGVGGFDPDLPDAIAEIERGWAEIERWAAPVDVEAMVERLLGAMRGVPPSCAADVGDAVRPIVEGRARLAREVERLNGQLIDMNGERLTFERSAHRCANEAREARAEIARLTADLEGAHEALDSVVTRRDTVDGPLLSLTMRAAMLARIAEEAYQQIGSAQSEIRRLRAAGPGEALARAKALLAPVDVEAEVEKLNGQIVHCDSTFEVLSVVRPLVEDRARLAREVDGLRVSLDTSERDRANAAHGLNEARAEIARLTAVKSAEIAPIIERFRAAFGADTPKAPSFTAAPGEAWERLPVEDRLALLDALTEEAGERRRVAAEPGADVTTRASCERLAGVWEAARAALMRRDTVTSKDKSAEEHAAALAAVEPTVDVTAITHEFRPGAQDGMPRCPDLYVGPAGCDTCGNAPGERHAWRCEGAADASAPAQIGPGSKPFPMPGTVWRFLGNEQAPPSGPHTVTGLRWNIGRVEALFGADSCAGVEHMMGLDAWVCEGVAPQDEVTDAELAEVARLDAEAPPGPWLTMGDAGAPMIKHLQKGSGYLTIAQVRSWAHIPETASFIALARTLLPRLALAEQARRAAPTMTAERAREVVVLLEACMAEPPAAGLAMVQRAFRINGRMTKAIAMLRAMSAEPTPPRALTEAEARAWAGALWVRTSTVDHAWTLDVLAKALLAASRGDVPPEVRPVPAADPPIRSDAGSDMTKRELIAHEAREMAVTTGEPEGVPSIAGPAGLDLASGRPAGFWNAGRPVERRGEEPPARPRVGAWIAWEPACGASIYDDHGQVVASAWETPDGWRWFANRAHLAPVQCSAPVSREEAEGAAVIVLSSWADVSAAGGES